MKLETSSRKVPSVLVAAAGSVFFLFFTVPRAAGQTAAAERLPRTERLAVAWNDSASATGRVRLVETAAPWRFVTPPLETGLDPLVRNARDTLIVVGRGSGTVAVVDPATWVVRSVFDLGPASQLVDAAPAGPHRVFLTRAGATHLLRLDLRTGATAEVVDLGPFADEDGVPDLGMMARHEGRLFVALRRESLGLQAVPHPALAVVDLATEELVDVDPATPGVQAIELVGTAPKLKMQVVPETRRLYVGATGGFHDSGGIEEVDLDALTSLGLVVPEEDGQVGAELGPFVFVTPLEGFLSFSTDFALSSHLSTFELGGVVAPVPDFYMALGYFAPALAFAPGASTVFFPEAGWSMTGVQAFDAATGRRLTGTGIPTTGPPTDLELVYVAHGGLDPEERR